MTFTLVATWDWFKHEDCRNAYAIHATECRDTAKAIERGQDKLGQFDTIQDAICDAGDEANGRFSDALKEFGFWHMVKVCPCAGGAKAKKEAKAILGNTPAER